MQSINGAVSVIIVGDEVLAGISVRVADGLSSSVWLGVGDCCEFNKTSGVAGFWVDARSALKEMRPNNATRMEDTISSLFVCNDLVFFI